MRPTSAIARIFISALVFVALAATSCSVSSDPASMASGGEITPTLNEPMSFEIDPAQSSEICPVLLPVYEGRAEARAIIVGGSTDEIEIYWPMKPLVELSYETWPGGELNDVLPGAAVEAMAAVEGDLMLRAATNSPFDPGAMLADEALAEQIHSYAKQHCPEIAAELIDLDSGTTVFAPPRRAQFETAMTGFCEEAGTMLSLRHQWRQSLPTNGPEPALAGAALDLYRDFRRATEETAQSLADSQHLIANGGGLPFSGYSVTRATVIEEQVRHAFFGVEPLPIAIASTEDAEADLAPFVEFVELSCPDAPADAKLPVTPVADLGVPTVAGNHSDRAPVATAANDLADRACSDLETALTTRLAWHQAVAELDPTDAFAVEDALTLYERFNDTLSPNGFEASFAATEPVTSEPIVVRTLAAPDYYITKALAEPVHDGFFPSMRQEMGFRDELVGLARAECPDLPATLFELTIDEIAMVEEFSASHG